jgi:hypothetical protein
MITLNRNPDSPSSVLSSSSSPLSFSSSPVSSVSPSINNLSSPSSQNAENGDLNGEIRKEGNENILIEKENNNNDDDDEPLFVSTKSLKRKREEKVYKINKPNENDNNNNILNTQTSLEWYEYAPNIEDVVNNKVGFGFFFIWLCFFITNINNN